MHRYIVDFQEENETISAKDILLTFNWLFLYDTYPVLSARWKQSEEYVGSVVIKVGFKMAEFVRGKISLHLSVDIEVGYSLDGIVFCL